MLPGDLLERLTAEVGARRGWPEGGASGMRTWLGLPDSGQAPVPYDLASAEFDLPSCEPERTLVIATDYRSGSTLLAEGLAMAGGYGVPLEYLQRGAMERKFARFAAPTQDQYLRAVMRSRTSSSGVFGIKLFWPESGSLAQLSEPVIVWLRRGDVVAQAVSTWTALTTGAWRSTSATEGDARYDRSRLICLVAMHAHHDACWRTALTAHPSSSSATAALRPIPC